MDGVVAVAGDIGGERDDEVAAEGLATRASVSSRCQRE